MSLPLPSKSKKVDRKKLTRSRRSIDGIASTVSSVMERSSDPLVSTNSGMLAGNRKALRRSIADNNYNKTEDNSLFVVYILHGVAQASSKRPYSMNINFDTGTLYLQSKEETHQVILSNIFRVQTKGDNELLLSLHHRLNFIDSPLHLRMENTGQTRELCIYIRLFRPDCEIIDDNEVTRKGGKEVVFKAVSPLGMMQRRYPCLLIVNSQALTVTFVPGEDEGSSRAQCFNINQTTQIVQKKTEVIIAFSTTVEPVTAVFKSSYQCLRFASWVHRLRHMSATRMKIEKAKRHNKGRSMLLPPPPAPVFKSGETFDMALKVWCGTWNVGEAEPSKNVGWLDPMVPRDFDVVVVALQECKTKVKDIWRDSFALHLNRGAVEPRYQLLSMKSMWAIHLIVYVKVELILDITEVQTSNVATGLLGKLGNKGAVGCGFVYRAVNRFAFVSSHLAARVTRIPERESNFVDIVSGLKLGGDETVDFLHNFDHVFWLGDLNYRVDLGKHGSEKEYDTCVALSKQKRFGRLLPYDQLAVLMNGNYSVFTGFQEGLITFAPTYRMERGPGNTWNYNNKKNQNPSWTDRVLWRSCQGKGSRVQMNEYGACHELIQSDHRPVYASFMVGCDLPPINPAAVVSNVPTSWVEVLLEDTTFTYCNPDEELTTFIVKAKRQSMESGKRTTRGRDGSVFSRDSHVTEVVPDRPDQMSPAPLKPALKPALSEAEMKWLNKSSSRQYLLQHQMTASDIKLEVDDEPDDVGTFQPTTDSGYSRNRSGSTYASIQLSDSLLQKITPKRTKERAKDPDFQSRSVLLTLDSRASEQAIETTWHRPKNGTCQWDDGEVPPIVTLFAHPHVVERHHINVTARAQGYRSNSAPVIVGHGEIALTGSQSEMGSNFQVPILLHGLLIGNLSGTVYIKSHTLALPPPNASQNTTQQSTRTKQDDTDGADDKDGIGDLMQIRQKVKTIRKLRKMSTLFGTGRGGGERDIFTEVVTQDSNIDDDSSSSDDEEKNEHAHAQRTTKRNTLTSTENSMFAGINDGKNKARTSLFDMTSLGGSVNDNGPTNSLKNRTESMGADTGGKPTLNQSVLSRNVRQAAIQLQSMVDNIVDPKNITTQELKAFGNQMFNTMLAPLQDMAAKKELKVLGQLKALLRKHIDDTASGKASDLRNRVYDTNNDTDDDDETSVKDGHPPKQSHVEQLQEKKLEEQQASSPAVFLSPPSPIPPTENTGITKLIVATDPNWVAPPPPPTPTALPPSSRPSKNEQVGQKVKPERRPSVVIEVFKDAVVEHQPPLIVEASETPLLRAPELEATLEEIVVPPLHAPLAHAPLPSSTVESLPPPPTEPKPIIRKASVSPPEPPMVARKAKKPPPPNSSTRKKILADRLARMKRLKTRRASAGVDR